MTCTHARVSEPVYFRPGPTMARHVVAEIDYCHKCERMRGDFRRSAGCPAAFDGFTEMGLRATIPPFVVVMEGGRMVVDGQSMAGTHRTGLGRMFDAGGVESGVESATGLLDGFK